MTRRVIARKWRGGSKTSSLQRTTLKMCAANSWSSSTRASFETTFTFRCGCFHTNTRQAIHRTLGAVVAFFHPPLPDDERVYASAGIAKTGTLLGFAPCTPRHSANEPTVWLTVERAARENRICATVVLVPNMFRARAERPHGGDAWRRLSGRRGRSPA